MTAGGFEGTQYRKEVLSTLRDRNPADIVDLFWLAHVPRDLDDTAAISARLKDAKGFLNKERSRQRQAAVASAVLKEWPRVESVLTDPGSRRALRERLGDAPSPESDDSTRVRPVHDDDPQKRRRRQVMKNLAELARLRDEPDLASDLFAFLGLPTRATREMIAPRLDKVGEVNRRRRHDRERTLVDELLVQARELLVVGDPAAYERTFAGDARDDLVGALLSGDAVAAAAARRRTEQHHVTRHDILGRLSAPAAGSTTVVPVSSVGLGTWCPACGTISVPGAHACTACRSALTLACPRCRTISAADSVDCISCGASLQAARGPLLAQREERRAEQQALARVDAAPEHEREALLARLAAEHPRWAQVGQRINSAPPRAPEHVNLSIAGGEARLAWPKSPDPAVDGYLVERHDASASRVLGRTGTTSWIDARGPGPNVTWTVRALRGDAAASPPTTATVAGQAPRVSGELSGAQARAGIPVKLAWVAPAGARVLLERVEHHPGGDVQRQLSVDPTGYDDRHVVRGRDYEYRVSLAGGSSAPVILRLTAGSGAHVTPSAAGSRPSARPAPRPTAPAPPPPRATAPAASPPRLSYRRPPAGAAPPAPPTPQPPVGRPPARGAVPAPPPMPSPGRKPSTGETPAVIIEQVAAAREPDGRLRVTWQWPTGVTEAFVAYDQSPPAAANAPGRKVTNVRYELDGGALLDGVPTGAHLAVFAGRRDAAGTLSWSGPQPRSRAVAP